MSNTAHGDGNPKPSILDAIEAEVNRIRGKAAKPRRISELVTDPYAPEWFWKLLSQESDRQFENRSYGGPFTLNMPEEK